MPQTPPATDGRPGLGARTRWIPDTLGAIVGAWFGFDFGRELGSVLLGVVLAVNGAVMGAAAVDAIGQAWRWLRRTRGP